MSDRIVLRGMRAFGRHGHLPAEREHVQPFDVDVELETDTRRAAESDDLIHSIDYRLVAREVRRVVEEESFCLLETLAQTIADRMLGLGATAVRVKVGKPAVALMLGAGEVAVSIERG
jgi:dihydroneopterin aldolase